MTTGDKLGKRDIGKVASVFYDDAVNKIWSHLGDLRMVGKQLSVVAQLLKDEKIKCFANVPAATLKGREAQYNSVENHLLLSPQITVDNLSVLMNSIILHEGVHAFIDYKKLLKTTYFHNEAVAYITQALFLRHKGQGWPAAVKADPLIKALEKLIDKFTMERNRAWLNWVHFEPLMRTIQAHPIYLLPGGAKIPWNTKTPADGVAMKGAADGLMSRGALATRLRGSLGQHADDSGVPPQRRGPVGCA